jgi:hypothetical protein
MKTFEPEDKLSKKIENVSTISLHNEFIETKSVIGIDIYKYSEYQFEIQVYIPVLFNELYKETVKSCRLQEKYFFQKYGLTFEFFKKNFISTGDGGFQIFDDPLQSLIFSSYFQFKVQRFNSGSYITPTLENLYRIIGRIELRYAITFDKIYAYDNNFCIDPQ